MSSTNKAQRNAIVTSMMVCCGFVICWSSSQVVYSTSQVVYFLSFIGVNFEQNNWFFHFTVVLVFTNSCINPFIYHFDNFYSIQLAIISFFIRRKE